MFIVMEFVIMVFYTPNDLMLVFSFFTFFFIVVLFILFKSLIGTTTRVSKKKFPWHFWVTNLVLF